MATKLMDPKKWHEQADFVRSLGRFMSVDAARSLHALAARLDTMGEERRAAQRRPQAAAPAGLAPRGPETR
jgi:hypothetical protein